MLARRNLCLTSFLQVTEGFLPQIRARNLNLLERFQKQRESLLKIVRNLDLEINNIATAADFAQSDLNEYHEKRALREFIDTRDSLLRQIIAVDLLVSKEINSAKVETIEQIQRLSMSRRSIMAYRSPTNQIDSAEGKSGLNQKF